MNKTSDTSRGPQKSTDMQLPGAASFSLQDIAVLLAVPAQVVFEWLVEGRLFLHTHGQDISLRMSDLNTRSPVST